MQKLAVQAGFGYIADVRPRRNVGGGVMYFAKNFLKDAEKWPSGRRVVVLCTVAREVESALAPVRQVPGAAAQHG